MVEIVETTGSHSPTGILPEMLSFFARFWWAFLLIAVIVALIIIVFQVWKAKEENDRRRDSAVYATASNIFTSAEDNARKEWVRSKWSFLNLFWFGIPFIKREHSMRVVDIDRNLLGFYRGHVVMQNGDICFLVYRTKSMLGLLENKFIIYCIKTVKKVVKNKNGKEQFESEKLPDELIRFNETANEIKIKCDTIVKHGNYYYFPSYIMYREDKQVHLDLSKEISDNISKVNFHVMLENITADMSRAMGAAVELNPHVRSAQKMPEKEKKIDDETNPIND